MTEAEISPLIDQAGFIFLGKVLRRRTKLTLPALTVSDPVPVLIEDVLASTDVMRGFKGREVFVVSKDPAALLEGASLVFFTNILVLGDHVVVQEIGTAEPLAGTASQITQLANERPLQQRVSAADLIISGLVISIVPVETTPPFTISEHDPKWWIARIAVQSVIKGATTQPDVEVLFANSLDIAWYKVPKLREGMSGVFSLRLLNANEAPPEIARPIYQINDPLDFLPAERLPDVLRAYDRVK